MEIAKNTVVTLDYTVTDPDGNMIDDGQHPLVYIHGGYDGDTPAAIVYKASWPDEKVYACTVATLAETAQQHGVSKTALIVVGKVLGPAYDRSLLYHPAFTHGCRQAAPEDQQYGDHIGQETEP